MAGGFATAQELPEIAAAFAEWSASPDGWFVVVHGEVLCTPGPPR